MLRSIKDEKDSPLTPQLPSLQSSMSSLLEEENLRTHANVDIENSVSEDWANARSDRGQDDMYQEELTNKDDIYNEDIASKCVPPCEVSSGVRDYTCCNIRFNRLEGPNSVKEHIRLYH